MEEKKICQLCNKKIEENFNNPLVICPECAAPYHKDCFLLAKSCIFEDVHGTEKDYFHIRQKIKENPKIINEDYYNKFVVCPFCLFKNPAVSKNCQKCGNNIQETLENQLEEIDEKLGRVAFEQKVDETMELLKKKNNSDEKKK